MADPEAVILALTGATAVGKTEAAMALADRLPVTIISMDSAMVYQGLDIGTAKPSAALRKRYPHELVDIRDPVEAYSAADFVRDADRLVQATLAAQRIPLLVGGTMLYLRAFREGLAPMPGANAQIRAVIRAQAEQQGWSVLYEELRRVDPIAANGIHPNNAVRIERALEVYRQTGTPMSQYWARAAVKPAEERHHARLEEFAIMPTTRAELHERIAQRVDQMLEAGLLDEVRGLYQRDDLKADLPALRSVGYRQAWQYLEGEMDQETLHERIIVATRQLAKRQLTWLRGWGLAALPWGAPEVVAERLYKAAVLEKP